MTGTPSRKTDPHQKWSSMTPPTTGPSAVPAMKQLAHTAMARPRCPASRNMLLIRARVEGIRVAAATPSSARLTISISALVE
jgi:hypothetical protein